MVYYVPYSLATIDCCRAVHKGVVEVGLGDSTSSPGFALA